MPRNLRIIKKLSKRAAPLLPLLGDKRKQFRAEKDENYQGLVVKDRKHWERCPSRHADALQQGTIVTAPRGRIGSTYPYVHVTAPSHPLKGTLMVGSMSGYEEPEWEEECAYGALLKFLQYQFFDYDPETDEGHCTRDLSIPRLVFQAAEDVIAGRVPPDRWED